MSGIPTLYDIHETARLTKRSVSWLYHHAGKDIPVTQTCPGGRLMWTGEQIAWIIAAAAVEPKAKAKPKATPQSMRQKPAAPIAVAADNVVHMRMPTARPEAKRGGHRKSRRSA